MNSPEPRSVTGLERLKEALALGESADLYTRKRATWDALLSVEHHAIADLVNGRLNSLAVPRSDLSAAEVASLGRARWVTSEFVIRAFQRGLAGAPHTLTAIARGALNPVHGSERAMLTAAVRRPMIAAGYSVTADVERQLTYTMAGVFADALAKAAKVRAVPAGAVRFDCAALTIDHDDFDWQTGEPLDTLTDELASLGAVAEAVAQVEAFVAVNAAAPAGVAA